MLKKMLKRALAEAAGGGYRSGKPWKKGKYGSRWHGPGPGYGPYGHDPYRHDPYRHDPYGHDPHRAYGHGGYRPRRGVKGMIIDAVIGWLTRRR